MFKPNLIPNFKVNAELEILELLKGKDMQKYIIFKKKDGIRLEVMEELRSRELNLPPNKFLADRYKDFARTMRDNGLIIEGEFYSHDMNFREISRFYKTENIEDPKHRKAFENDCLKFKQYDSDGKVIRNAKGKILWKKFPANTALLLQNDGEKNKFETEWPGRTIDWMCTNNTDVKLWIFDADFTDREPMYYRKRLEILHTGLNHENFKEFRDLWVLDDADFTHALHTIEEVVEYYHLCLNAGWEGLVLSTEDRLFKHGRHTIKTEEFLKLKEDKIEYKATLLSMVQRTEAREGSEKSISKLGRSKTSKLAEDRVPVDMCAGFHATYNGEPIKVSLKGFDHAALEELWLNQSKYIGRSFMYTGMKPTKLVPRHAFFEEWD